MSEAWLRTEKSNDYSNCLVRKIQSKKSPVHLLFPEFLTKANGLHYWIEFAAEKLRPLVTIRTFVKLLNFHDQELKT